MKLNKTQEKLVSRLDGISSGNLKNGWTKTNNTLSLQKLNEGEQAHKLAEKYPEKYKSEQLSWRLVRLTKL